MRTLSERDAAAVAAVAAELAALEEPDPFPPHVLARLAGALRTPTVSYCELDRARERTLLISWWEEDSSGSESPTPEQDAAEPYWPLQDQHPVCGYRKRSGDWTSSRMASDFVTLREFRRTDIWDQIYREDGINYWLDVGLRPSGAQTRMFLFPRERSDFDERDRLVLDLLQPHLQRRYTRAGVAAEAAGALASLLETNGDDPRHVVLCSSGGTIEFASPESRRLLSRYLGGANGRVPAAALRGTPLILEREGRRLTVRAAPCAGLVVLLLGEEDVRLDLLTARQRAILARVAGGETDAQIGEALGIASATVGKHLERIYERLGVHTRTAAAAVLAPRVS